MSVSDYSILYGFLVEFNSQESHCLADLAHKYHLKPRDIVQRIVYKGLANFTGDTPEKEGTDDLG